VRWWAPNSGDPNSTSRQRVGRPRHPRDQTAPQCLLHKAGQGVPDGRRVRWRSMQAIRPPMTAIQRTTYPTPAVVNDPAGVVPADRHQGRLLRPRGPPGDASTSSSQVSPSVVGRSRRKIQLTTRTSTIGSSRRLPVTVLVPRFVPRTNANNAGPFTPDQCHRTSHSVTASLPRVPRPGGGTRSSARPLDLGEYVDDPGQVLEFFASAFHRGGRLRRSVGRSRRRDHPSADRQDRLGFRVGVDGQVAVGAEVPGQEVPGAAGQRVRTQRQQREGSYPHWSMGGSSGTAAVVSARTGSVCQPCARRPGRSREVCVAGGAGAAASGPRGRQGTGRGLATPAHAVRGGHLVPPVPHPDPF